MYYFFSVCPSSQMNGVGRNKESGLQAVFFVLLFQISISHLSNVDVKTCLKPTGFPRPFHLELLLTNTHWDFYLFLLSPLYHCSGKQALLNFVWELKWGRSH